MHPLQLVNFVLNFESHYSFFIRKVHPSAVCFSMKQQGKSSMIKNSTNDAERRI